MIKIAVLEDDDKARESLLSCLQQYAQAKGEEIVTEEYNGSFPFLDGYHNDADVLFFDIEMPGLNGMEVAKQIRQNDTHVIIVFVTNLAQFAIEGYSVNAFDFVLKPIRYSSFELKLDRIFKEIHHHKDIDTISLNTKNGVVILNVSDILYVEVKNHDLIYHLPNQEIKIRGTMASAFEELSIYHFELCNACYLVNLKYVRGIKGNSVIVHNQELSISQSKHKTFLSSVAKYLGGTK